MLITSSEFADFRNDITKGWEKQIAKIERCIADAESVDLFDVMGSFYFDIVENATDPTYADLMNGVVFTGINNEKSKHIGIKAYLAGLAYSRYLTESSSVSTPFGMVNKLSQDSSPVDYNAIRDTRKELDRSLEIELKRIDLYLRSNLDIFPNYATGNDSNIHTNAVKTSTLR